MSNRLVKGLLVCGIFAPLLYVALDIFAAWQWLEYRYFDQAVSELSSIGAPTQSLWTIVSVPYLVLFTAFAGGVWLASGPRRPLRVSALLLLALTAVGIAWFFVPMHQRGAETTWTDTGHKVVAVAQVVVSLAAIAFAAAGLGGRFRRYSIATLVGLLVAGAASGLYVGRLEAGLPTPGLGVVERLNVYGYMLWVLLFAVSLLHEQRPSRGQSRQLEPSALT